MERQREQKQDQKNWWCRRQRQKQKRNEPACTPSKRPTVSLNARLFAEKSIPHCKVKLDVREETPTEFSKVEAQKREWQAGIASHNFTPLGDLGNQFPRDLRAFSTVLVLSKYASFQPLSNSTTSLYDGTTPRNSVGSAEL